VHPVPGNKVEASPHHRRGRLNRLQDSMEQAEEVCQWRQGSKEVLFNRRALLRSGLQAVASSRVRIGRVKELNKHGGICIRICGGCSAKGSRSP